MLFYNPGGSGEVRPPRLRQILDFFPAALRARFDIVSWDPRGVGESSAVQCFPDLEAELRFLDGATVGLQFPVGKIEHRDWIHRYRAFGPRCGRRNGGLLRHVGTADTARDLNLLRRTVGDPKLNYLGVSYGTFLGATYEEIAAEVLAEAAEIDAAEDAIRGEDRGDELPEHPRSRVAGGPGCGRQRSASSANAPARKRRSRGP